jgi:hypothetical protein
MCAPRAARQDIDAFLEDSVSLPRRSKSSIMKPEPLLAAFAKVERATTQIGDVESRIQLWAQSNPYSVVNKINPHDPREEVWSFIPKTIGFDLPVVVGEALHNIRSPLDQMLSAVAEQRGSSDGIAFPFGKSADIFERALSKQKKLLPADAIDMIRALKPYKEGNVLLWAINELNRGDKHRPKLLPVLANSSWNVGFMAVEKGGALYITGDRRNGYLATNQADGKPYVPAKDRHPYVEGETEFVICAPGTKFHTDMQPLCKITFGQIEAINAEPVVAVLQQMRDLVERILLTFERRFFS